MLVSLAVFVLAIEWNSRCLVVFGGALVFDNGGFLKDVGFIIHTLLQEIS